jgi:hypothetical protein
MRVFVFGCYGPLSLSLGGRINATLAGGQQFRRYRSLAATLLVTLSRHSSFEASLGRKIAGLAAPLLLPV